MDPDVQKKLDTFFSQFNRQAYKKGELLIRADDEPSGVFYLTKGQVKQYVISKKGDEIILNIFKPISFFPMLWAVNDSRNIYFYEATADTQTYLAPKNQTIIFIKTNPDILYNLVSRIYKGTEGLLMRMAYLMSGSAYPRLITELLIQTKRFGEKNPKTGALKVKIFEKDLAAESGMTRETVSREMKVLKNKKLVSLENNILTVNNLKQLEEELENY